MSSPSSTITIPEVALHRPTTLAIAVAQKSVPVRFAVWPSALVKTCAAADGKALADLSLDELEVLWQLAKTQAA